MVREVERPRKDRGTKKGGCCGLLWLHFFDRPLLPLFLPCSLGCEHQEGDQELTWRMDDTHSYPHLTQIPNFYLSTREFPSRCKVASIKKESSNGFMFPSICHPVCRPTPLAKWFWRITHTLHATEFLICCLFSRSVLWPWHPSEINLVNISDYLISPITVHNLPSSYCSNILRCYFIVLEEEVKLRAIWFKSRDLGCAGLYLASYCCDKHCDQKWCGEERVTSHHWEKTGQESGSRNWGRDHVAMSLTDLLSMACSACFLFIPRTLPMNGIASLSWTLRCQSLTSGCPMDMTTY